MSGDSRMEYPNDVKWKDPNDVKWKDDLLATSDILQSTFYELPEEQKLWMIENKHIFYNVNGGVILNLTHPKYKQMAKILKISALNRYNGTYWNTTDLPKRHK